MSSHDENTPGTIDDPQIINRCFYPRRSIPRSTTQKGIEPVLFSIEKTIAISGRYFQHSPTIPTIIFFHGNGEIAADYEDIGPIFGKICGANLLVLDYRGYGESTGNPSNSAMIADALLLFPHVKQFLEKKGIQTPLLVMGRSLGSVSAIEIALHYEKQIAGLILESAFSRVEPLLEILGVPTPLIAQLDVTSLSNSEKLKNVRLPLLVIHGQDDFLIPVHHGKELFEVSPSIKKTLIIIPGAEHNTIMLYNQYFGALRQWIASIEQPKKEH